MLAETTELADLQVFPWSASPLTDSNRRPPPYHGGFDLLLCDVGTALASALSLHFAWFVCLLHPSFE
jgi:hypothetical protein